MGVCAIVLIAPALPITMLTIGTRALMILHAHAAGFGMRHARHPLFHGHM